MRYKYRFIIAGILLLGIVLINVISFDNYITIEHIQQYAVVLQNFVAKFYWLSVLSYCTIFITATVCAIPVTVLLTIVAGFLYGIWLGALYAIGSATVGSSLVFIIVRYLLGEFVQKYYSKQLIWFNAEINRYGYRYLLMLQLLPITPTPLINILAGLTCLSLRTFAWITALGIVPGTLIYTFAGQQLHNITSPYDLLSFPVVLIMFLLALLAVVPMLFRRWYMHQ